jgi:hypothetical protein
VNVARQAAAGRRTVYRCDQRLVEILDRQCFPADSHAVVCALGRAELGCQSEFFVHQHVEPVPGRVAVEVAHVGARAERIAFACRNHHPHSVRTGLVQRGQVLGEQCPGQPVALLWPVEPADQNGAVSLDHDFGHRDTQRLSRARAACPR